MIVIVIVIVPFTLGKVEEDPEALQAELASDSPHTGAR